MNDERHQGGLSSKEAAKRLQKLGAPEDRSSRSVASIVAGNVFTLFNAIIGVFFIVVLSFGLFADALFGFIAILNSYIGIRQEIKAKETLESLALLVAPRAKAIRDGKVVEVRADEVVPGDWIRVEPGDQLVADGELTETRGLTLDESMLTGEADGVRKQVGQRALSGSFVLSGSGYYEVDAVRQDSYAEKVAGEARAFRHPPSPLQEEVNSVLRATTWLMLPLAVVLILALNARNEPAREAVQTATAGLITLIPEGLVLLMTVTLAVAAVRLARLDTLVQQISATEALAAVDTICVDKTGTLTTGELKLVSVEVADQSNAGTPTRRSPGSRAARASATEPSRRSPRGIRRPGNGWPPRCRSPPSGNGAGLPWTVGAAARPSCSAPPTCSRRAEPWSCLPRCSRRSRSTPVTGAAWSHSVAPPAGFPMTPTQSRPRRSPPWPWWCSMRPCARTPARRLRSCASRTWT